MAGRGDVRYSAPMRATALLAPLVLLAAAGTALAAELKPCRGDIERFCAGVPPGEGRIRDCIRSHAPRLSPACRAYAKSVARRLRDDDTPRMLLACKEDIETLCRSVPPGDGRWRRCLDGQADRLSDACRALLTSIARR